jgi:hypothetical protein
MKQKSNFGKISGKRIVKVNSKSLKMGVVTARNGSVDLAVVASSDHVPRVAVHGRLIVSGSQGTRYNGPWS